MSNYPPYPELESDERGPILFGQDISRIPCFRDSWLYGISTGLFGGLVTFMGTSRPQLATKYGIYSLLGTTVGYWIYCRYNWMMEVKSAQAIKELIKAHNEAHALVDESVPPLNPNQPDLEIVTVSNKK